MRTPSFLLLGLGFSFLALAGCGEEATEPTPAPEPTGATALAVASDIWLTRANMGNRTGVAVATVTNAAGQSVVYAIGGLSPDRIPSDKVHAYNVATNTWSFRRVLPRRLAGTNGAGVINGKIYVSGGYSDYGGDFPIRTLYMYDPAANIWTQKSDIPVVTDPSGDPNGWKSYPAGNGVTGVINGKLYVVSGCFEAWVPYGYYETCDPLFFRYNPVTDRWAKLPSPPIGQHVGGGGVIGGKLYVMGNAGLEGRLAVYDPRTDRWTLRTPLARARYGLASAVLGGKLYVMGGVRINPSSPRDTLAITIVYDPATDTWTRRAPLPSPRAGIAASRVLLDGKPRIEVLGGIAPGNNLQYVP